MKNLFDENYFERGIELGISGYSNYRWMPELTIPMCFRLIEYLGIKENETILDFGCAKGYVVKAFRLLYREAFGYDISDYALSQVPCEIKKYVYMCKIEKLPTFDWIIAKDVLEHISHNDIENTLYLLLEKCNKLFCVIPLAENDRYNVSWYESDITHIIRESLEWWGDKFSKIGFTVEEAKHKVKYIKENYSQYEKGNGFFTLLAKRI